MRKITLWVLSCSLAYFLSLSLSLSHCRSSLLLATSEQQQFHALQQFIQKFAKARWIQSPCQLLLCQCSKRCQHNVSLTSWDVHGKGKTITLVLRLGSGREAATDTRDQPQPVSSVRYRKKSLSELKRDSQLAIVKHQSGRQQTQLGQQMREQGRPKKRTDTAGTQTTDIAVVSLCLKVQLVSLGQLITRIPTSMPISQKTIMQSLYNAETPSQQCSEGECDSAHDSDLNIWGTATDSKTDTQSYRGTADTASD